ncbi:hypothetical protein SS50377_28207 [Spironucleus salmonicida]|uniref:Uncharacterized protein n=1 Tax=Spironucleus salmonicida TaxID=348837 RepID=A0A9P8RV90_9EUKA|nr:hypothetical protein SS50377_28207 [Spironucleus salmonicida]
MPKLISTEIISKQKINLQLHPYTQFLAASNNQFLTNLLPCNTQHIFKYNLQTKTFHYLEYSNNILVTKFTKLFTHIIIGVFVSEQTASILYFQGSLAELNLDTLSINQERKIFTPIFAFSSNSLIKVIQQKYVVCNDSIQEFQHQFGFNFKNIITDGNNVFVTNQDVYQINKQEIKKYNVGLLGITQQGWEVVQKQGKLYMDGQYLQNGVFITMWMEYLVEKRDNGLQLYKIVDYCKIMKYNMYDGITDIIFSFEGMLMQRNGSLLWFNNFYIDDNQ